MLFEQVEVRTPIIFTTAYSDHALEAFERNGRALGTPLNDDTEFLRIWFSVVYPEPVVLDARCGDIPVMIDAEDAEVVAEAGPG